MTMRKTVDPAWNPECGAGSQGGIWWNAEGRLALQTFLMNQGWPQTVKALAILTTLASCCQLILVPLCQAGSVEGFYEYRPLKVNWSLLLRESEPVCRASPESQPIYILAKEIDSRYLKRLRYRTPKKVDTVPGYETYPGTRDWKECIAPLVFALEAQETIQLGIILGEALAERTLLQDPPRGS